MARYSESRLINGIAISESETRVADAALSLLHDPRGDTSWEINTYARDQAFRAVFAAVNVTRTIATPSLDQFVVPSRAYGANGILRHRFDDQLSLDLGADARLADGATNENFQNIGQGFTRVRRAGGEQTLAGAFAELNWQPVAQILATVGGRVDSGSKAVANGAKRRCKMGPSCAMTALRIVMEASALFAAQCGMKPPAMWRSGLRRIRAFVCQH